MLAEVFRVLWPGGRLGISDVVTDGEIDPVARAAAERRVGCVAGFLTVGQYRDLLLAAGFVGAVVTLTVDHGDGVRSAIVQAVKPAISPGLEVRPMREDDAGQVLAIYRAGLDSGQASFETIAPGWEDFTAGRLSHPRYVTTGTQAGEVVGWVAASRVSARPVYAGVVEHGVYVHPGCQGPWHRPGPADRVHRRLTGRRDLDDPIGHLPGERLQPVPALGFRVIGTRTRIGRHHGVWRDVILLERRSTVTEVHPAEGDAEPMRRSARAIP